jgi:hypothetical protein
MKYIFKTVAVLALGITVFSCNKREIIPAPIPKVELKNHFIGNINGAIVELTENVNGYSGTSGVDLIINASSMDSAVYHSIFKSSQSLQKVTVGHGSLVFDWNASERPILSAFESFFLASINQTPPFSTSGLTGFTVSYTDGSGKEWKSNANGSYPNEDVTYNSMAIESDSSGDYAKFKVSFDTYIYNTYYDNVNLVYITDSLLVTDAVYTGWYKR